MIEIKDIIGVTSSGKEVVNTARSIMLRGKCVGYLFPQGISMIRIVSESDLSAIKKHCRSDDDKEKTVTQSSVIDDDSTGMDQDD